MIIHFPAFVCALPALCCTYTAVVVVMLFAFLRAGIAEIGTQRAQLCCTITVQAHQPGSSYTHCTAFHIEADAIAHIAHMRFFQAGHRAMVAYSSAFQAGFDTGLIRIPGCHKIQI